MITDLRIRSLGVIEESVLELGPGLTVITGETGAGKTMLVTALGLLLGGRADSGAVRTGATSARVEGTVRVNDDALGVALSAAVEEVGGEVEDGELLLGRQVYAEGRSRAFVGGTAAPASALAGLADRLVIVHGQSDQQRLLAPSAARAALDAYAGTAVAKPLAEYEPAYRRLAEVVDQLRDVVEHARERAREADLLRHGLGEIEAVDPRPGEDLELAREESRLGAADTLREAAERARTALSADDESGDAQGAVARARAALESVREHDPEAAALAQRIGELSYLLSDVAADVASYAAGLETDPARLEAVSTRRADLLALTRKYGDTVAEVLSWAETSAARLAELDGSDQRIEELRAERDALRERLGRLARQMSAARQKAAARLGATVTGELGALAMPHAVLTVAVTQRADERGLVVVPEGERTRFGPHGVDDVELLLAANPGAEARPVQRGASGGELSRVMLALEVAIAGTSPVPTFVFDEVDAGVGGKAAVEIGRRLAALARSAQVLVVTHLAQVAAFADRHVVVRKADDGSVTTSGLDVLDEAGRVRELSRMLAGLEESATAQAHAEELLAVARDAAS